MSVDPNRRCQTCGKPLRGSLKGGRLYCSPECWPSRSPNGTAIDRLLADREHALAAIERGDHPRTHTYGLIKIERALTRLRAQGNGGPSDG